MDSDPWCLVAAASKRRQSAPQSRQDLFLGSEEIDCGVGEEDPRVEFPCPFCSEGFDIVGLCCHIDDEHSVDAKNGVCPVCAARVGMDMVGHITMHHGNFFKMQGRRFRKGSSGSRSMLSLLRKELREGNLQSLLRGSSYMVTSSTAATDPFLASLVYTFPVVDSSGTTEPDIVDGESLVNKSSDVEVVESVESSLSYQDIEERTRRSGFAQELLLSTVFNDNAL